ncbi:hypothetical protein ED733_007528 [Metarhizium rileyi]|uniref:Multi antimicrobial extrusion protein n=1 Tax=Metarhizium rileyi (strain RCEF 4871) TaxID=1649241 RepID=A0A5C6GHF1_METRR|nr:hypothetical protein ED733_007528 [Metarhizium rileyi]
MRTDATSERNDGTPWSCVEDAYTALRFRTAQVIVSEFFLSLPLNFKSLQVNTNPLRRHTLYSKQCDGRKGHSFLVRFWGPLFRRSVRISDDEVLVPDGPAETSPLLQSSHDTPDTTVVPAGCVQERREVAVLTDEDAGTWLQETNVIAVYAAPLVITYLLQYSIDMLSVMAVGRMGTIEIGAVSLANMSAGITCWAPVQGLATSLDTLCAQAHGSGRKQLVGLYCQRVSLLLLCFSVPICVLWIYSEPVIAHLVPDARSAQLASLYLKLMIFAIPGYIVFEVGKRFLQAQGLFRITTYILVIAASCHVVLIQMLVGKLGFIGAPIAVIVTRTVLPVLLVLFVVFLDGSQCWGGFSKRAFNNWVMMLYLAVPGMVMVEAEWVAFEMMLIASSYFGTDYLAAQSILASIGVIFYQVPFAVSIAASTRVACLIGAGLVDAARVAAKVTIVASFVIGLATFAVFICLKSRLPFLFTQDSTVAELVRDVLPVLGIMKLASSHASVSHGLLRGIGRQSIGGPANLFAYYLVALPSAAGLGFGLDLKVTGLFIGFTIGLFVVSLVEYAYLYWFDWHTAVSQAAARTAAG